MKTVLTALLLVLASGLIFSAGELEEPAAGPTRNYALQPAVVDGEIPDIDDPVGREVSMYGVLGTLTGNIYTMKGEWFINDSGISYEMHMGPIGHDTPDMFIDNTPGTATGFIYKDHIAPITVETANGTFSFWREDGFPLWAGGEGGANRVAVQGERGIANPAPMFQRAADPVD